MLTTPFRIAFESNHRDEAAHRKICPHLVIRASAGCAGSRRRWRQRYFHTAFDLIGVVRDVLQHRAQIFKIEQEQAVFVGYLEDDLSTPSCVSFNSSKRARAADPSPTTVARTDDLVAEDIQKRRDWLALKSSIFNSSRARHFRIVATADSSARSPFTLP